MKLYDLSGRTYVITGGTQGLGEETARVVARCGAAGITICGRNREAGERVAADLTAQQCPTQFVVADLTEVEACLQVVRAHDQRFGRLDGLGNVGASTARGTIEAETEAGYDAMMNLNLRAPFFLIQEAVKVMQREERGGSIVNISSISAHGGQSFIAAYSAAKGGLNTLTKNVAFSQRRHRIRVNALNVGWMATPAEDAVQKKQGAPADWLERADRGAPFGRIIRPAEVAAFTAYLFSDESLMMTGACIDFNALVFGAFE